MIQHRCLDLLFVDYVEITYLASSCLQAIEADRLRSVSDENLCLAK